MNEVISREHFRDIEMMMNPDRWPALVLAVKRPPDRPGPFPELGVMLPYSANVYKIGMHELGGKSFDEIRCGPREEFDNYDATIDAGWIVD